MRRDHASPCRREMMGRAFANRPRHLCVALRVCLCIEYG